ncbi:MAG: imidazole glycerol phosphate synthase subunit HisH [Syntrophomonas sp.]
MRITVIDYGIGNILSVIRALTYCGAEVLVTDSPDKIKSSRALILPGVGAFEDGMRGLRNRNIIDSIKEFERTGHPFMGICLGMQMMLDVSEEFGIHKGLGLIPGKVARIDHFTIEGEKQKTPHIGWNKLELPLSNQISYWDNTILSGIDNQSEVYFVHSYTAIPDNNEHRLADAFYGGRQISAVIKKDNLYGCQFHPEKSGSIGLKIMANFIQIC